MSLAGSHLHPARIMRGHRGSFLGAVLLLVLLAGLAGDLGHSSRGIGKHGRSASGRTHLGLLQRLEDLRALAEQARLAPLNAQLAPAVQVAHVQRAPRDARLAPGVRVRAKVRVRVE